jgi:hypothetical protein
VTRIALPADIVARIRAGEDVSAEEITAAQQRTAAGITPPHPAENEWLPPTTQKKSNTRGRGRRSRK